MSETFSHQPVLLTEVLEALNIKPDGCYIDATFGRGGHAQAILNRLNNQGRLIALDQDPEAVSYGQQKFADDERIVFEHCNFSQVGDVALKYTLNNDVDGALMDLGVSSPQLDDAARGFSFVRSGPLDMRMNTEEGQTARDWLLRVEMHDLVVVLKKYGEERFAKRIAHAIIDYREDHDLIDTVELAEIIASAIPVKEKHKHPATRSFQAIRMYINQELTSIEVGLEDISSVLSHSGRLAVISFHSLEDRLVKRFMRNKSKPESLPPEIPVMNADIEPDYKIIGKAQVPSDEEIVRNPRARSARLRVLERLH